MQKMSKNYSAAGNKTTKNTASAGWRFSCVFHKIGPKNQYFICFSVFPPEAFRFLSKAACASGCSWV
jgi:hypothetical protein